MAASDYALSSTDYVQNHELVLACMRNAQKKAELVLLPSLVRLSGRRNRNSSRGSSMSSSSRSISCREVVQ